MIGDADHYFNRKLVEKLQEKYDDLQIDFFSIAPISNKYKLPYDNIYINSVERKNLSFLLRQRGIYSIYIYHFLNKSLTNILLKNKYNFIHLQSAQFWITKVFKNRNLNINNLIITIWGSDFYRASSWKIERMRALFKIANKITFASIKVSKDFDRVYNTINKHHIVRFGLDVFEYIDRIREKNPCKLIHNKINVTIGYNRHPLQQHLFILKELNKLDQNLKDKIKLIIPFTYGPNNKNYLNKIKAILNIIDIEYEFIFDFMEEEVVAKRCLESDIMIQLQKTDAFSGSMQEYLYANNIVITGSWLPYDDIINEGLYFERINKIDELAEKLGIILTNLSFFFQKTINNPLKLAKISSWDQNIPKWYQLYN